MAQIHTAIQDGKWAANMQQRGKMTATQPKWRQFCVEDGGLLEIIFFADQIYFCWLSVSDWFWLSESMFML